MAELVIKDKYIILLGKKQSITKIYIEVIKNKLKEKYKDSFNDDKIIENFFESETEDYGPKQFVADVLSIEKLIPEKSLYFFIAKYNKKVILDSAENAEDMAKIENIIFSFSNTTPLLNENLTD